VALEEAADYDPDDFHDTFSDYGYTRYRTMRENLRDITPLRKVMGYFEDRWIIQVYKKVK